jgi:hypothetical protein
MKTVTILIERDEKGLLHAYVIQPGPEDNLVRGADMLRRRPYRQLWSAEAECRTQIATLFVLLDPPKIEFIFPPEPAPEGQREVRQ